jgi:hypothetical protein
VIVTTDLSEGVLNGKGGVGFHMDSAFLPQHYETTPRQNYYITILALTPVVSGGGAFCYAPGSLAASKRGAISGQFSAISRSFGLANFR